MGIERQLRDSLRRSAGSLGEPSLRWEALETGPRSAASSWVRVSIAAVVAFSIAIASFVILRDAFSQGPSPATVAPTPPPTDTGVHVPFENLRNGQLYQAGGQAQPLVGELSGGLMGFVSPVGVDSPDGTQVAYNAWTAAATGSGNSIGGTPSIRVIDTSTGSDTLFADGAFSLAWRRDGVIAYFRGRSRTYTGVSPYQGDIVVRGPGGAETTWSRQSDRYIVAAWAGNTLLAYRELEGEVLDLVAFDGPGQERSLGTNSTLISVSPDGTRALVFDGGAYPPTVRLVDIASGEDLGSADLFSVGVGGVDSIQFLGYGGDWVGEYAVAESDVGLVRLHIVGVHVSVSDVMAFKRSAFPIQPHEPQFLPGSDSKVYAWAPMDSGNVRTYRYLICNFVTTSCDVGDVDTNDTMFAEVHNPSRPLSGHE